MNKKLKIYSGMLIAAILVFVMSNVISYNEATWYETFDDEELTFAYDLSAFSQTTDTINGEIQSHTGNMVNIEVNVEKKRDPSTPTIVSHAGEQESIVTMRKAIVSMPADKVATYLGSNVFLIIAVIPGMVIILWILWLTIQVIRSIKRGEFFSTQFSKALEKAGILLSVYYILQIALEYIITSILAHKIHIAHYYIVFKNDVNPMIILMGLSLMVISQIMLIAKDIKEEQDLTI